MTNKEEELYEQIHRYLFDDMTADERSTFEQAMTNDTALAEEVELHRALSQTNFREDEDAARFKKTLQKIHAAEEDTSKVVSINKKKQPIIKYLMATAAAIALLILGYNFLGTPKDQDLYAAYVKHEPMSIARSAEDVSLQNIQQAFNEKNYRSAYQLSEAYLQTGTLSIEVLLAKGIAALELGKYEQALKTFERLEKQNLKYNKATWYKAMTYLKKDDRTTCKKVLQEIVTAKSYNYQKAAELIKEIQ